MNVNKRLELIKRNTEEIITEEELRDLLRKNKNPSMYWGTAITGKPHIAYFLPLLKIADFMKAGFKAKILLSDLTGALDNTPWNVLDKRYEYYKKVIPLMLEIIGVDTKKLEFVKALDMSLNKEYFFDLLKLTTFVSMHDAHKAASDFVKFGDNPKLSGFLYPLVQSLDEEYLKVDMQFGGTDQRKTFVLARENLPKIGYKRRIEIMNPLIPGLIGKKMSASDEKSKIELLDDEKTIKSKLINAECEAGNPDNGIMAFLRYVIMVIKEDKKEKFIVKRDKKFGGNLSYGDYEQIEKDFKSKKLHPLDLKNALAEEIVKLLKPFQDKRKEIEKLAKEGWG